MPPQQLQEWDRTTNPHETHKQHTVHDPTHKWIPAAEKASKAKLEQANTTATPPSVQLRFASVYLNSLPSNIRRLRADPVELNRRSALISTLSGRNASSGSYLLLGEE